MIVVQDLGELAFGGVVTLTEWWDSKRVKDGKITNKEILKKAGFWTYLGIGLIATLVSAFGWWRRQEKWMEHVSHGFIYDFPRFIYNIVSAMRTTSTTSSGNEALAVQQAKEILRRRQQELASRQTKSIGQGQADVTQGLVPITESEVIIA